MRLETALTIGSGLGAAFSGASSAYSAKNPNVVIIYGDVGACASKMISTPNIDRLASEGLRFTDPHNAPKQYTDSFERVLEEFRINRYCN